MLKSVRIFITSWFIIFTAFSFMAFDIEAVYGAWQPPIGIPTPPFGIAESAPAAPNPWTSAVAGYYYVCPTCAGHTDSANPYGYPSKPRDTIPATLPAGSVVEVHGQIDTNQSFTSQGTVGSPVFVRGADYASRPKLTAGQGVSGSYVIMENIWWGPLDSADNDFGVGASEGSDHIAIRDCEVSGNLNRAGGFGLGSWGYTGAQSLSYVVINNCNIHHVGDVNAATDQDSHGITVNGSVDHLWVTYNEISYTSGDAMQVEAQQGRNDKIHHVYYGKNHAHHNKQTGGAVKHATDVIFSQNTVHDHRAGNSSQGACMNTLYGPEYMWFLFNEVYNCNIGIGLFGNDGTAGQYAFVIGNIIHNIHAANPTDPYNAGAIVGYGGVNVYYINNTIYDVDAGFNLPPGWTSIQLHNNIIANRTNTSTYDIYIESDPTRLTIQNDLFPSSPRFYWGGTIYTSLASFQSGTGKGQSSLSADPLFTNPGSNNFSLQSTSPAIDAGALHPAYATFQTRYGIDISKDFTGAARPQGAAWDIGAYEVTDPNAPVVQVISPTTADTYPTTNSIISLSGTATPAANRTITGVICNNDRGGNCNCSGTASWSCNNIPLQSGQNIITVTATDNNNSTGVDILVVNYTTSGGGGGNTPPPSSGSDSSGSVSSGGSGCGFVKDDGKGQGAKGEGLALIMMLILTLAGIAIARRFSLLKNNTPYKTF